MRGTDPFRRRLRRFAGRRHHTVLAVNRSRGGTVVFPIGSRDVANGHGIADFNGANHSGSTRQADGRRDEP